MVAVVTLYVTIGSVGRSRLAGWTGGIGGFVVELARPLPWPRALAVDRQREQPDEQQAAEN